MQMSANRLEVPELKIVNECTKKQRTQTPDTIRKLLYPVNNLVLEVDDESNHSELSDKYQDLYKEDCRLKTYVNQSVLDHFSEDYKKTATELRQELEISNSINQCFSHIGQKIKNYDFKFDTSESTYDIIDLKNIGKDACTAKNDDDVIIPAEIWNLLLVNSKDAAFQITPPNYNCFNQTKRHWLETPPVPWEIFNISITKCQKWLEDQEF